MTRIWMSLAAGLLVGAGAMAQDMTEDSELPFEIRPAVDTGLDDLKWIARPIVIFADTPLDPLFREQMNLLAERPEALADRDVVVIVDTDPDAESDIRRKLRPRGFSVVLIGKDGGVKQRKPFPWDVRELTRAIDKMPLRQQELRGGNRPGG